MLPRVSKLIDVAGDTLRTNFPSDRVSEMLDLAQDLDSDSVRQVVLGAGYAVSESGPIYKLHLKMDKLAALSIEIFGSDSRYSTP